MPQCETCKSAPPRIAHFVLCIFVKQKLALSKIGGIIRATDWTNTYISKGAKKMYEKNLTEDFRLRLSSKDMDFLKGLAEERQISVSECVRGIIGEYRRSLETMDLLKDALEMSRKMKEGVLSNGDTKTDINDKL